MYGNTDWRRSSHGQRELLHLYVLMMLVSMRDINSCLLWLELNYIPCLPYLKILIWLVACHHKNYACYHLPTWGRAGIKLGDVDTSQRIYHFCLLHACFVWLCYVFGTLLYTFDHIWTNLLTQCTQCQFLSADVCELQVLPIFTVPKHSNKNI